MNAFNACAKALIVIAVCSPCGASLLAQPPKDMVTAETLTQQNVADDEAVSPYMITGEALVSLMERMVDFNIQGARAIYNRRSGQLFVRNTPDNHERVKAILNRLREKSRQQISIESRIITVSSTDFEGLGLDLALFDVLTKAGRNLTLGTDLAASTSSLIANSSSPAAVGSGATNTFGEFPNIADADSATAQFGAAALSSNFDLRLFIDAIKSKAEVNTLSAPRLTVSNNQRAHLKVQTAEYYVQEVGAEGDTGATAVSTTVDIGIAESGTILDVTPTINADGTVTLELHPHFVRVDLTGKQTVNVTGSSLISSTSQPFVRLPIFTSQSVDTTVTVENGGTAVLGGLINETETITVRKVPLLGSIPLIGWIFQNKRTQEVRSYLIMFVKATIKDPKKSFVE